MAGHSDKTLPEKPRVVVGLDFGTTYSGFAFAHVSDPEKVYTYYDYPKAAGGEKPYCKTLTASYYKFLTPTAGAEKGKWQLHSWGYPARAEYERDIHLQNKCLKSQNATSNAPSVQATNSSSHGAEKFFSRLKIFNSRNATTDVPSTQLGTSNAPSTQPGVGVFLSRFKLHLASRKTESSSASPLPPGLTIEQVITDFLRELGGLILKHLQDKYGAHFNNELIQWCITVPSIWDNSAKATMKACMVGAGLVCRHPLVIVLEPEAASFHCQRVMGELTLDVGNKLLVADIGGGTSDIVVQEVVSVGKSGYRVKEVTMSSGGLCGGTYVDSRFMEFLEGRIGPCLLECILKHPNVYGQLMKQWECTKSFFDCGQSFITINLPNKLAAEWETSERESSNRNMGRSAYHESQEFDELEISFKEMQSIFDPIVQENLDLIQQQLVEAVGKIKVLVLVGGFTESPYLLHRIKQTFGVMVESIVCPPNPGSAICQGAVALPFNPNIVMSRICKLTYGFEVIVTPFDKLVDPIEYLVVVDGVQRCSHRFQVLVKKGDEVMTDKPMSKWCKPVGKGQKSVSFNLFSCEETTPSRYTTDKLVKEEGKFVMDISGDMKLDKQRTMEVSLFFGGSFLEVKAEAVNFIAQQVQHPIEIDYLLN